MTFEIFIDELRQNNSIQRRLATRERGKTKNIKKILCSIIEILYKSSRLNCTKH